MATIKQVYGREIIDSRANPTVEAVVILDSGEYGVASVPSGTSTGTYEAVELRDGDPARFLGRGVLKAVGNINGEIASALSGRSFDHTSQLDPVLTQLDGTPNKSRLGTNAILGVSMAFTKAAASVQKLPLYRYLAQLANNTTSLFVPTPVFNMINGGKHGAGNLDFQEFHVIPRRVSTYAQQLEVGVVIYQTIERALAKKGAIHSVGHEGGFAPNLFTNLDALEILVQSINECHKKLSVEVELGLDIAANTFFKDGRYTIKDRSSPMETNEFIEYIRDLNNQYHLRLLEDALNEDDWRGWSILTAELGRNLTIVGDDLLVTNKDRVAKAVSEKACSGIVVKLNEVGTVTEAISVISQSRSAGWKVIVAHRSGETNDTFIADFAVGVGADYAKMGAPARGERVAKYNRFLTIEAELAQNPAS